MAAPTFGITTLSLNDEAAVQASRHELAQRARPPVDDLDGELLGFACDLRRLLKRERLTDTRASALAGSAWLRGAHVRLFRGGRADDVTLLASRDEATTLRALELEDAERRSGGHRAEAIRWMGEALGYPACCVAAFAARVVHDDEAVLARLLGGAPWSPLPWPSNPFVPGHSLVTHYPCRLDCPASEALAARLFAHLEARAPDRAARTRALLQAPLVLFDRFCLVALEGARVEDDVVSYRRAWLPFEGSAEPVFSHTPRARLFLTRVAPLFAASDEARFGPGRLELRRGGRPIAHLETAPGGPPFRVAPLPEVP